MWAPGPGGVNGVQHDPQAKLGSPRIIIGFLLLFIVQALILAIALRFIVLAIAVPRRGRDDAGWSQRRRTASPAPAGEDSASHRGTVGSREWTAAGGKFHS